MRIKTSSVIIIKIMMESNLINEQTATMKTQLSQPIKKLVQRISFLRNSILLHRSDEKAQQQKMECLNHDNSSIYQLKPLAHLGLIPADLNNKASETVIGTTNIKNSFMKTFLHKSGVFAIALTMILVSTSMIANAADRYSVATGNWNAITTWAATSGGAAGQSVPVAGDNVFIEGSKTVTVTATSACTNLSIATGSALTVGAFAITVSGTTSVSGTLTHNSTTGTKTYTGDVTINSGGVWNETAAAVFSFGGNFINNATTFTASTGIHTFSGSGKTLSGIKDIQIPNVTISGSYTNNQQPSNGSKLFVTAALNGSGTLTQGAGSQLQLSGTISTLTLDATTNANNVVYDNGTQTVYNTNYSSLLLYNGTKTLQTGTTHIYGDFFEGGASTVITVTGLTIDGQLGLGNGPTFNAAGFALTVNGELHIGDGASGIFNITSATGATSFNNVFLNTGSQFNNTSVNAPCTITGWIHNSGTFNAGTGVYTLTGTTSEDLSGTLSIPNLTVNGTYSNNGTLTVGTTLAGSGTLTQGANSTLNIGGTSTISTLDATTNTPNTVNYNASGTQIVHSNNYYNLTLSGTSAKTLQAGTTSIGNNLSINPSASASLVAGTTITANTLTINGVVQSSGTWGSSSSTATYKNNTYFGATSGMVNVGSTTCTTGQWLGTTSTDWFTASNWCGGVPTSTTNVVIPSGGNQPVIGAAAVCNNITINSGATLTFTGSNTLTVSGNWANNGAFTANTSTVTFNGTTQNISGVSTNFANLTISSSTSTTLGVNTG